MAERSSLDEALARIVGISPAADTPRTTMPTPSSYRPPETRVTLGSSSPVAAGVASGGSSPAAAELQPSQSSSDAARQRYEAAKAAAEASIPAGAQPIATTYDWRSPQGTTSHETRHYTASAMPMDPALYAAMESARKDYFSAIGAPYQQMYTTAAEAATAEGYGPETTSRQVAMPTGGFKTITEGPGLYKEDYNYSPGLVSAPTTGREFMAQIGMTRPQFKSLAASEKQALRGQYGRL